MPPPFSFTSPIWLSNDQINTPSNDRKPLNGTLYLCTLLLENKSPVSINQSSESIPAS